MNRRGVVLALVALVLVFGVGFFVGHANEKTKTVVASTATPTHDLAPECRSALKTANDGLGLASSGLSQAQGAASATSGPANQPSPALGIISATNNRVLALLQQYNSAQAACESVSAAPQVTGSTSSTTGK